MTNQDYILDLRRQPLFSVCVNQFCIFVQFFKIMLKNIEILIIQIDLFFISLKAKILEKVWNKVLYQIFACFKQKIADYSFYFFILKFSLLDNLLYIWEFQVDVPLIV